MKPISFYAWFAALLITVFPSTGYSQSRAVSPVSPIVNPDRTVTFNFRAPTSGKVELSAQFLSANQPLQKDSNGNWSITVGPIEPDIYPYHFIVDGISVADPNNPDLFPNERFKASLVEIPGEKPLVSSVQNVPRGKVTYCWYYSERLGTTRPILVYTPPGYDKSDQRYPVFYLVSGTTDTEETWLKVGRANVILDNLIAQKKAEPMIIVMPYGNMLAGAPRPSSPEVAESYKLFSDELIEKIIPYVEENFKTIPHRESRAIAGFSRGGGQSLFTGFSHFDKFAWMGSYSAYLTQQVFDQYFGHLSKNPDQTNDKLKLLWLGVGSDDFLYKEALAFMDLMKERKINHISLVTGGGHTWMNSRLYLTETLQKLFKQ